MSANVVFKRVNGKCVRVGTMRDGRYYRMTDEPPPRQSANDYKRHQGTKHTVFESHDREAVEARRRAILDFFGGTPREPTFEECDDLVSRFGDMCLADVAALFGVSRERIRQIESIALRKLARCYDLREMSR